MTTTTTTTPTVPATPHLAPEPAAPRGWPGVPCPRCADQDCISVYIHDLHGDEALHCGSCEADFGVDEVRHLITAWTRVLAWFDAAPRLEE